MYRAVVVVILDINSSVKFVTGKKKIHSLQVPQLQSDVQNGAGIRQKDNLNFTSLWLVATVFR
jgi:hypothetical protein